MARKYPLPKRVAWLTAIGLFSCWALLIGCGKKGPPVVPGDIPIAAVADLDGELEQTTVTLTWTHPKANARIRNYVILRAQFDLTRAEECTGCPLVFQKVGEQAVEKNRLGQEHKLTFSLSVPKGFRYTFSVRPSRSSGVQGPDSNMIEIILPK